MSLTKYPTRPMTESEDKLYKEMESLLGTFCKGKTPAYKLDFMLNAIAFNEHLSRAVIASMAYQGNTMYKEISNVKSRPQKYPN